MRQSLELEINKLFQEHRNSLRVADQILRNWNDYNIRDKKAASLFLIHSGFYASFFEQIAKALRNREPIPWPAFAEALGKIKAPLNKEDVDSILLGAAEENALDELVTSHALDPVDSRFAKIRGELKKEIPEFNPKKPAHKVSISLLDYERRLSETTNPEERAKIVNGLKGFIQQDPSLAYVVAVTLHMMEFHQDALDCVRRAVKTPATHWLELEILIALKMNLEVLEKCKELEASSLGDSYKPLQYYKACAEYGLGEKTKAIDTLEALVNSHPDFDLTRVMLQDWKK